MEVVCKISQRTLHGSATVDRGLATTMETTQEKPQGQNRQYSGLLSLPLSKKSRKSNIREKPVILERKRLKFYEKRIKIDCLNLQNMKNVPKGTNPSLPPSMRNASVGVLIHMIPAKNYRKEAFLKPQHRRKIVIMNIWCIGIDIRVYAKGQQK
ncbi:conserved hypothetical protein [Ricinus communis]|uniref:Uncharacterized protein n=1 Tax=Ricinus communis TaxID=3988 RepID=B9SEY6_RICCO|nr:conserved hypothetical protein [Ricinus communis]